MLKVIFWISAFGAIYSYFLYPLVLSLVPTRRTLKPGNLQPKYSVSLIVTAHNEERRIREKIENTLEIQYPELELIVASDASTDGTDAIVKSFDGEGVSLSRTENRLGKENAQKQAISHAKGEILVFSDVATKIPSPAIRSLVEYFRDPEVGAVSSVDVFVTEDGGTAGEGAYIKYEMWLRKMESLRGGLIGLSGSFFAARRELCQEWDIHSPSDFNIALSCASHGYVAVSAPDVQGHYKDVADPAKEYQRKLRTVTRGLTALSRHPQVANPFRYGLFGFQLLSHKVMRWLVPWFLCSLFVANCLLLGQGFVYTLAFFAQVIFYGLVGVAHLHPELRKKGYAKIPYFFTQVNYAVAKATLAFLGGKRMTVWSPTER